MALPIVYTDDVDATWTFTVSSRDGTTNVDWVSPVAAIDGGTYTVACTFLGSAAPTRQIRVPLGSLTAGVKTLRLKVPNGTDILLGKVHVVAR
jgi:FlaG/FlaF family flagellin (archaellin)